MYKWRVLSGSGLKVLAMVTMLIDHTAAFILRHYETFITPLYTIGHQQISWYWLMRSIGRLAFPLFCFLIVEGFLHTHDRRKYGRNLLLFALISEIPFNLTHGGHLYDSSQNVFFTLFLGFLALWAVSRWEEDRGQASNTQFLNALNVKLAIRLSVLLLIGFLIHADYSKCGISFILLLYVLRQNRILQAAIGCTMLPSRWMAGLAFIPINLYNGQRGFIQGPTLKYMFYAFYPFHLMVIYFIMLKLGILVPVII